VNPNHPEVNVAAARADPDSIWHYYRDLVDLRHEHDVLVYGGYTNLGADHEDAWAYERTLGDERAVVVLNFGDEPLQLDRSGVGVPTGEPRLDNYPSVGDPGILRPYEARLYLD
jgi:oligo-1,6-glucosidase